MALIFQKDQHKYARYVAHIVHLGHLHLSGLLYASDREGKAEDLTVKKLTRGNPRWRQSLQRSSTKVSLTIDKVHAIWQLLQVFVRFFWPIFLLYSMSYHIQENILS